MKICCCWLYAISRYGYPPSLEDTFKVIREMKAMGFEAIELEGVKEKNLLEVSENRKEIKSLCEELTLEIVNFCPVLPDLVSSDPEKKEKAMKLFEAALEIALYFGAQTIQIDSYTPAIQYRDGQKLPLDNILEIIYILFIIKYIINDI